MSPIGGGVLSELSRIRPLCLFSILALPELPRIYAPTTQVPENMLRKTSQNMAMESTSQCVVQWIMERLLENKGALFRRGANRLHLEYHELPLHAIQ